jgi:DNA-binding NtrC family response regulator
MIGGGSDDGDGEDAFTSQQSTFLQARFDPAPEAEASFLVSVIQGPDLGVRYLVDGSTASRVLVGTSPVCDFRLTDRGVSRRHLALELEGVRLRVVDLESTNGVRIGSIVVRDVWLSGGEHLQMGGTTVVRIDRGPKPKGGAALATDDRFGAALGASLQMRRLFPLLHRLAASSVPVVIEGETGTGKEVLAEAIHAQGSRRAGPFVVFDCTAVPPNLVESELFGHERGAFTGAVSMRKGVFEQAHGGTLLIDEIGDLELALQPKLLRALERSEVRRVGGDKWIRLDVRVLAATRRDLDREVQAGRFRDDLFHRLAVGRVELPPLRKRGGDVPLLVAHFCRELGGNTAHVSPQVMASWEQQTWPGNVRELRNAVARHLTLGELAHVFDEQGEPSTRLPPSVGEDWLQRILDARLPLVEARERVLQIFEHRYIDVMLTAFGGNVAAAARASGIARRYFQILNARRKG